MPLSSEPAIRSTPEKGVLACRITPGGSLQLYEERGESAPLLPAARAESIRKMFDSGRGHGVLHLGAAEPSTALHPTLAFWRDLGRDLVSGVCASLDPATPQAVPEAAPEAPQWERIMFVAPPMEGGEFLASELLEAVWHEAAEAIRTEADRFTDGVPGYLRSLSGVWNLMGRVCLHLAEVKRDPVAPFAFLATYVHEFSDGGAPSHRPLGRALDDYAGKRQRLLSLLAPISRACENSRFLRTLVESGDIYHPLSWTPEEAHQFLLDIPVFEKAGLAVRMPNWWNARQPPRPRIVATVGDTAPSRLGVDSMLDFEFGMALDGELLTAAEVEALLASKRGLALVRGKWVEADPEKLSHLLGQWQDLQERSESEGISFGEAMRMMSGMRSPKDQGASVADRDSVADWSEVAAGKWLTTRLERLRSPQLLESLDRLPGVRAELRPYQKTGTAWLVALRELGLGGCLADDMGLGKTLQVLASLACGTGKQAKGTDLLVVPASLIDNWRQEIARFVPAMRVLIAHPSRIPAAELKDLQASRIDRHDAVIISYGALLRYDWVLQHPWRFVVLDEAQAIKNPNAAQTRAAKRLRSQWRLAMTGTPVENRLGDLWSIFDFLNRGLLGSAGEFNSACKTMAESKRGYAPLRTITQPFLLRRMKTDKSVISDLPDKTEVKAWCSLRKLQAALYAEAVEELKQAVANADGIRRRGLVFAFLMRFKQICNHPSQWLGDSGFEPAASGKFGRLTEICDAVAARQDKVLVFTQFRSMIDPLSRHLAGVFGRPGLSLHGGTAVKRRQQLVRRFQDEDRIPFMAVSLKAGGVGLNLTAASHVIHFDRWWNPAVEDQATDRAFRIGQKNPVLVHKFVCKGTVEERIDAMIEGKQRMSGEVLSASADSSLVEMSDEELLAMVSLDLSSALRDTG